MKVDAFINENLPGYVIKVVPGDGKCILSAFSEALLNIVGKNVKFEEMVTQLRREFLNKYEFYKQFCTEGVDLLSELERFLEEPLRYYNIDVVALFIKALGNAFEVNIIIFQSNAEQCWIINLSNE